MFVLISLLICFLSPKLLDTRYSIISAMHVDVEVKESKNAPECRKHTGTNQT